MNRLKKVHLKNIASFKDQAVEIENNNGFVVINGINLDSNIAHNPNGAGKSLFFSSIPTAAYEADPLSLTKKNKKDLHVIKNSCISLLIQDQEKEIELQQLGSKYKFFIDGEDQKTQKGEIARSKFASHWNLSEEEFYATSYIQSQRPCSFQKAKPSERLNFITDLFDLHIYDMLRAHFAKKRTAIKDKEIEFKTMATQLEQVERSLGETKWNKTSNSDLKELRKTVQTKRKELEDLFEQRTDTTTQLDLIKRIIDTAGSLSKKAKKLSKIDKNFENLKKNLEQQIKYQEKLEDYEESLSKYKSKKKKLLNAQQEVQQDIKSLEKLIGDRIKLVPKDIKKEYESVKQDLDKYKESLSDLSDKREKIQDIREEMDELIGKVNELGFDSIAEVPDKVDNEDEIVSLKNIIELWTDLEGHAECPTCLQGLNQDKLRKNAKRAKKRLPILVREQKAFKIAQEFYDLEKSAGDTSVDKIDKKIKKLESKVSSKNNMKQGLEELAEHNSLLGEIHTRLEDLEKPSKPKGKIKYPDLDLDTVEAALELLEEYQTQSNKVSTLIESIGHDSKSQKILIKYIDKANFDKFDSALSDIKTAVKKRNKSITKAIDKINSTLEKQEKDLVNLENAKSNWKLLTEQQMELESKLEEAKPLIEEKKIVETLYKTYSSTSLKLEQAVKILKLIEKNLNQFSHMVFPETMVFQLDAGTRGIDAIVTRKNGMSSDISKLSGAETNCFRLLFAISILPLIPSSRRTNFLILDEPDSACSEAVREHLVKEFIPKLRTLVPHIFWITPKPIDTFSECEIWTVEKQNGVSTIKVGNPV